MPETYPFSHQNRALTKFTQDHYNKDAEQRRIKVDKTPSICSIVDNINEQIPVKPLFDDIVDPDSPRQSPDPFNN